MATNFARMRIAIYTGMFPAGFNETYHRFIVETIKGVIASHKEHEFILLSDKPESDFISSNPHCTWAYLQLPPDNSLLWKWWMSITVPGVLKKIKAQLFVSTCMVTAKTKLRQCLIVTGLQHLHYPEQFTKTYLFFFRHFMSRFSEKAQSVVAPSDYIKMLLSDKYKVAGEKITTVPFITNTRGKVTESKRIQSAVEKISDGKLFFLVPAGQHITHELLDLLKAFSKIKKIQQTNMRLVISGKPDNDFHLQLSNYKYREDVIIYQPANDDEVKELCKAAYAVVLPSGFDDAGVYCISALRSGVPVICMKDTASEKTAGNAALSFEAGDYSGLASCMAKLYKDEEGRKKLIEKGKLVIEKLNAERPEILLWQAIEKAIG